MEKKCKECGDGFHGRSDAKFCSDQCRSSFNNKNQGFQNAYVKKVNITLRKNRKILEGLNPNGKARVHVDDLRKKGFDLSFYTNVYTTKAGKSYHFCYDQGYISHDDEWYTLVTKHDYV